MKTKTQIKQNIVKRIISGVSANSRLFIVERMNEIKKYKKVFRKVSALMLVLATSMSVLTKPIYAQESTVVQGTEIITEDTAVETTAENLLLSYERDRKSTRLNSSH